jgi:hypothetical protein
MTPEEAFQETVAKWEERLFTDTPQGRSLFAHGAAFVLKRLRDDLTEEAWEQVRAEMTEFSEAYRVESERQRNHPQMVKIREALAAWEQVRAEIEPP